MSQEGALHMMRGCYRLIRRMHPDGVVRSNRSNSWHSPDLAPGMLIYLAATIRNHPTLYPARGWFVAHPKGGETTWHRHAPEAEEVSITGVMGMGTVETDHDGTRIEWMIEPGQTLYLEGSETHRVPKQKAERVSLVINWKEKP